MSELATGRAVAASIGRFVAVGGSGALGLACLVMFLWPLAIAAAQDAGQADADAGPAAQGADDLRKQAQNPLATLISLPFERSLDFGAPGGSAYILNVQPVIPVSLGDWNLINRTIIPFASVSGDIGGLPGLPEGAKGGRVWGLGDINHTSFLSPADSGPITWGVGPSIQVPSATDDQLGTGKWAIGPSAVFLAQPAPWSVALLVRQIWSFAGKSDRDDVSQFLIQPFINYNLEDGWVSGQRAGLRCEPGGEERPALDRTGRRRPGPAVHDRRAADQHPRAGFLQRREARQCAGLGRHAQRRPPVPEIARLRSRDHRWQTTEEKCHAQVSLSERAALRRLERSHPATRSMIGSPSP